MDFRAKQIAPPRDWAVFEDLCLAIFRNEWNDALALKNGRIGQPQHGVDVYGSPSSQRDVFYGVQCKGKDRNFGAKATVRELKDELAKADMFVPKLEHWVYATTATKDGKLQAAAREISAERAGRGLFQVAALGWEDIQSLLARHPNVVADFYPEHAYDIAGLLNALRDLPSGTEVLQLREQIKILSEAQRTAHTGHNDSRWDLVSFGGSRDLGPALLGRGLGPADASSCPRLQEADSIVTQLRRAFSARLVGGPGTGKSVCAYQAAADFAAAGWNVLRIRDASAIGNAMGLPPDDLSLLLLDDAHLMPRGSLEQVEQAAGARRLVLSIHNGVEDGPLNRGAIVLDARRAVKTIAAGLLSRPEQTLSAVKRADDDVGPDFLKEPLERRIEHAESNSDRPWQFCFILGGGWKRASDAANAARAAGADLVLAAAAIVQLASRDAPLAPGRLRVLCAQVGIGEQNASPAIAWLAAQRLLLSDADCRCPHQRFALVVLGRIIEGQDGDGRRAIGQVLRAVVRDASFPIAGLRILLHELRFLGDHRRWTSLLPGEDLEPLIARCWNASSADDRMSAALLFSDLDAYVEHWFDRLREHHRAAVADWITNAAPPAAYGLSRLLNALRNSLPLAAPEIAAAVDPAAIARVISAAAPDTADHCAELVTTIGWQRTDAWKATFNRVLDRNALVGLARTWPSDGPLYGFAHLCAAIHLWDGPLGLEMVEAFIPTARSAFADNPVSAFRNLEDIADRVLRVSDPLGAYVGKLAPGKRESKLAKAICANLKPRVLAEQLSESSRRDFQTATFFLAFLRKAYRSKFTTTVEAIDWTRIARTIGDGWTNLSHHDEILLTVSYSVERARALITQTVGQNLSRMDKFPPRLAIMMPELAVRHLEAGRLVRLGQYQHIEFEFGAIFVAQLAQLRPDLVESMLEPFESLAAEVLSQQNASWFMRASTFIEALRETAPLSLQRILSTVDAASAEAGWTDSLQRGGAAQDAVALLVESALMREDAVGQLARHLRKRYRARSVPKMRKRRRRRRR